MDLSKLPKLSETPDGTAPTPATPPESERPPVRPAGAGAEAWFSIAIGIILLFVCPNLFLYLKDPSGFAVTHPVTDGDGSTIPYTHSIFFWGDLAISLFALVLIGEGLIIGFLAKPMFILIAFIFTIVATLLNLGYVGWMMSHGYGFQILSGLAVAFGGYIALYEWKLLTTLRQLR